MPAATPSSPPCGDGDPRIAVGTAGEHAIALNPQTVVPGEELVVLEAVRAELA